MAARKGTRPSVAAAKAPKRPSIKEAEKAVVPKKPAHKKTAAKKSAPKKTTTSAAKSAAKKTTAAKSQSKKTASQQEGSSQEPTTAKTPRLDRLKRSVRKTKADKAFNANYASSDKPASESTGSRAALYKGKMGTSHKRSARMQEKGKSKSKGGFFGAFSGRDLLHSPKIIGSAVVVGCLVLSCMFLYPAAKDYYIAVREQAQIQAEYEALAQRSAAIQAEVDRLSTSEGIEDKAREEFGWVKAGDNSVSVFGLSGEGQPGMNANVTGGSIPAPTTWYSPMLDAFFGVNTSSVVGS
ncbi:MAG: septum formation initiator family protein [Raoultibacter sp.]